MNATHLPPLHSWPFRHCKLLVQPPFLSSSFDEVESGLVEQPHKAAQSEVAQAAVQSTREALFIARNLEPFPETFKHRRLQNQRQPPYRSKFSGTGSSIQRAFTSACSGALRCQRTGDALEPARQW